jgi:hypothetical protein
MRAVGLGVALILAGMMPARAQTLLETVLYIVSLQEPRDDKVIRDTVTEDEDSIDGEIYTKWWTRSTLVKRIGECKFEVDDNVGPATSIHPIHTIDIHPIYTIDFSAAELENAHPVDPAETRTRDGYTDPSPIVIPQARFCLLKGTPLLNDIDVGSCVDRFYVHAPFTPTGPAELSAVVRSLRRFCAPKVS